MTQPISIQQLTDYISLIQSNGVEGVRSVYSDLYNSGYNYTGWALGVVTGETMTGIFAMNYLNESTQFQLSNEQIDKIKVDMALNTLNTYLKIAENTDNKMLSRDFSA